MSKGKAPAFQLFAADALVDTASWSVDEVGMYFRLLMTEWVNGPLPNNQARLARIAGCGSKKFQKGWETISVKFILNGDGFLINRRLEQTREEQDNYRKSQQEAGKKGAEKRWGKDSDPNGDPIDNPNSEPNGENIALHSSSSISSTKELEQATPGHFSEQILEKITKELEALCLDLKDVWPEFNPYQAVQRWASKYHHEAILHVLRRMAKEKELIKSPWGFANKVIEDESKNYHARDGEAEHIGITNTFKEFAAGFDFEQLKRN